MARPTRDRSTRSPSNRARSARADALGPSRRTETGAGFPVRRMDFEFDPDAVPRHWYGGDPFLTAFWNGLSLLFPEGEQFFVRSVRHYLGAIEDPALRAQVLAFIGQEAMHGKEHRAFNAMLERQGVQAAPRLEAEVKALLALARKVLPARWQLAVTCSLEHYTAILAEQLLELDAHQEAIDPALRPLWLWHALEESEHKAVAFDVYRATGGTEAERMLVMIGVTVVFVLELLNVHSRLLAAERQLLRPRSWARGLAYFWGRERGLFRRLAPAYLDYFRPGFHPDDRDRRALLDRWRERFGAPDGAFGPFGAAPASA